MLEVKVGDIVTRNMGGITMDLKVTQINDDVISCGDWTFDKNTGMEIDEDLNWGPQYGATGSFIIKKK